MSVDTTDRFSARHRLSRISDFGGNPFPLQRKGKLSGVTRKPLSNSKDTLLCFGKHTNPPSDGFRMKSYLSAKGPIAVLIDGDNMAADKLNDILTFVSSYGRAIVRRIYADWTKPSMARWKEEAKEHSFRLVEALSYVGGKNTTDMALIIDAMDLLHAGNVKGFCIVSSDSDYTLLAQRIREEGLLVLGYGERKSPVSLQNSFHQFRFSDTVETISTNINTPEYFIEKDRPLFDKAFEMASKGEETVTLSLIGGEIKKLMPKYKIRRYGCKTLGQLYVKLGKYELVKTGDKAVGSALRLKYEP